MMQWEKGFSVGCHWLCQCKSEIEHRLPNSTGEASGTLFQHNAE
jgi:hypothetical protein